jgi:hypothetical protein
MVKDCSNDKQRDWHGRFIKGCTSPTKGKVFSQTTRTRMSKAAKKRGSGSWMTGKKHTLETRRKMSVKRMGFKPTKETIRKISEANLKKDAGYVAIHMWIKSHYGRPKYCEHCKRTDRKRYEWANKYHTWKRKIGDYMRLCTSCHRKYDHSRFGKIRKINCKYCDKLFSSLAHNAKYCSNRCSIRYRRKI